MASLGAPVIEHVIVVMLENRSYDNVLGWLYNPGNDPPYRQAPSGQAGLQGLAGNETNPGVDPVTGPVGVANQPATTDGKDCYPGTVIPIHDPGEPFKDMAQQIVGSDSPPTSNPYVAGDWPPAGAMQGFTLNYARQLGPEQVSAHLADIMNYFTPAQLPVTAWLANHFAVCDRWFASVPTQTFTNRAFAHCAAPAVHDDGFSLVDDAQYVPDSLVELPSVFSRLDDFFGEPAKGSPPNWKVYFHDYSISTIVAPYVLSTAESATNVNVAPYDDSDWGEAAPVPCPLHLLTPLGNFPNVTSFVDDLNSGRLPRYAFIEPRYSRNYAANANPPNSNHPGKGNFLSFGWNDVPTDAAQGEAFLLDLYNALFSSGALASSLLIITYDEHGGVYDHVVPPSAIPPGPDIPPAGNILDPAADGFDFNVYGCRVPTIVVSPFIAAGTTITPPGPTPFDHTSILRTVMDCFDVPVSLIGRAAAAPSLYPVLSATANNNPGRCPVAPPGGTSQY